ncbi:hypothetical protein ACTWQL_19490 [Pseudalkalibacillus sp. R45]
MRPLVALRHSMVSPVPLIPLESRTLLSNQLAQGDFLKILKKEPFKKLFS